MLVALFGMSIISRLNQQFTGQTVGRLQPTAAGRNRDPPGAVLSFPLLMGLTVLWAVHTSTLTRAFGEVITAVVLRETPMSVIMFLMLAASMYMAMHEAEVIARVNELLSWSSDSPVAIDSAFVSKRPLGKLAPLFSVDWHLFLMSVAATSIAFAGF